jgi:hypothetical protein
VQAWRIIAAALLGAAGILLVPIVMAKVRDHTGKSGHVAISGVVTLTALLLVGVVILTVLPGVLTWVVVAVVVAAVSVMVLAG